MKIDDIGQLQTRDIYYIVQHTCDSYQLIAQQELIRQQHLTTTTSEDNCALWR